MKRKLISMMVAVSCMALICGCGGKEKDQKESESTVTVSENDVEDVTDNDVSDSDVSDKEDESEVSLDIDATEYVVLGAYKGVEISVPAKVEFAQEDYEIEAKSYYFSYVNETEGITNRPVELLDMTNIDYVGKKDGVAFDGGTAQGATLLIGSGQFIDGFEEGLIGVMPGETVDLNLTFPENYGSAELAGQDVVFTVTVNFIPEMKDEKVAELGIANVSTVEEFMQYVKEFVDEQVDSEYMMTAGDAAIKQVVADSTFAELPEELLEKSRQSYRDYLDQMASMYGMDGATYVATYGGGVAYDDLVNEYAESYTKESLVAKAIAQYEGLIPTDEEVDARLEEYAAEYGYSVEALLTVSSKDDFRDSFIYEDVLALLVENAVNKVSE